MSAIDIFNVLDIFYIHCMFFPHTTGTSKISAKNNASEKALRDLVIQKMVQVPKSQLNVIAAGGAEG